MDISTIVNNKVVQLSAVGAGAAGIGFVSGYFIGKQKGTNIVRITPPGEDGLSFDDLPIVSFPDMTLPVDDDEPVIPPEPVIIDAYPDRVLSPEEVEAKVDGVIIKEEVVVDEEDDFDLNLINADADEAIVEALAADEETQLEVENVFENASSADDDWDWDVERAKRSPGLPYIIHEDEFIRDEMDLTQKVLTFYAADGVLAAEDDSVVYNYGEATGPLRFGHGTNMSDTVHIRNEELKAEYQIVRDPGSYEEYIQGLQNDADMESSLTHSIPKFRFDD